MAYVVLRCLGGMVVGVLMMAMRGVRVMRCLLVIAGLMVLCRFLVMVRGVGVVLRCFVMMLRGFL
jgi:hypothetical protein